MVILKRKKKKNNYNENDIYIYMCSNAYKEKDCVRI